MRFGWEADIPRPLEEVRADLEDPQHPLRWQPGLVRIDQRSGEPGREGAQAHHVFDLNGTSFVLTETVLVDRLPEERTTSYEGRGIRHRVTMSLRVDGPDRTILRAEHDGYLAGIHRLLALPLRRAFRERWLVEFTALWTYLAADRR